MEDQSHTVNLEEIDTDSRADGERRGCMVNYAKILDLQGPRVKHAKILDPQGPFTNWIFLMLCVISISMDPLFFYIPVINVDKNCMELDKNLGVISSVFRSVIDLFYIICIRYQLRTNTSAQRLLLFGHSLHKSYIDLLAVLPLPQSGVVDGSYLQKFMYCFRWGLQSLSCFAQNLITSTDIWENIFTITITISSVVLFIFLLGNMQLYLQSKITRSEDMKLKVREIEQWKTFKKLSEDLQRQIQNYHQHLWRETKGVDVENLLNKFPRHLSRKIKCDLCLDLLKKVPNFGSLPVQQLKAMCERLKPVLYPTQTCIIGEGDPVDEMFFIMSGKLSSTRSDDGDPVDEMYLNEFCGEELSTWFQSSSDQLPISTRTITTHTEVEAFALMANDLKDVFKQFRRRFPKCLLHTFRYHSLKWRCWAAWIIQVAWRCYCLKKHEDVMKRVKKEPPAADGSSTSSIGATPFATNEIRHRNSKSRMLMKAPAMFLRKPADPDLMDKEK
ncbi:hypothetical protein QYF36_013111 [Acer negundo]|nr:hypothetical protein QYF36_013111 [Acer negundo]